MGRLRDLEVGGVYIKSQSNGDKSNSKSKI